MPGCVLSSLALFFVPEAAAVLLDAEFIMSRSGLKSLEIAAANATDDLEWVTNNLNMTDAHEPGIDLTVRAATLYSALGARFLRFER